MIDERLPIVEAWEKHLSKYYAPKTSTSGTCLVGPNCGSCKPIVDWRLAHELCANGQKVPLPRLNGRLARDVEFGMVRYLHSTGHRPFHRGICIYSRGLMYGSYKKPRELVWIFGMTICLALMAEAFLGYLLLAGAKCRTKGYCVSLRRDSAVGEDLAQWIRG